MLVCSISPLFSAYMCHWPWLSPPCFLINFFFFLKYKSTLYLIPTFKNVQRNRTVVGACAYSIVVEGWPSTLPLCMPGGLADMSGISVLLRFSSPRMSLGVSPLSLAWVGVAQRSSRMRQLTISWVRVRKSVKIFLIKRREATYY